MWTRRIFWLFISFALLFSFCIARLIDIQVIEAKSLTYGAIRQRSDRIAIDSNRGKILDRNQVSLEKDTDDLRLILYPQVIDEYERVLAVIRGFSSLEDTKINQLLQGRKPLIWPETLSSEELQQVNQLKLNGVLVTNIRPLLLEERLPGEQYLASHTLGYCQDGVGIAGLTAIFEDELKSPGALEIGYTHNATGEYKHSLGWQYISSPVNDKPYHLVTTLDRRWQETIEGELHQWCQRRDYPLGSVVALKATTGEVMAMASYPPLPIDSSGVFSYNNYAISSFLPGSIFKIVVAAAAIAEGKAEWRDRFVCEGELEVGDRMVQCWEAEGHGELNLAEALHQSCNVAFIQVMQRLGSTEIMRYAKLLGLGEETQLGLTGEKKGNLPAITKVNNYDPNHAIGQGAIQVTPLQVARMLAVIVNDGRYVEPYLIDKMLNPQGVVLEKFARPRGKYVISPFTATQVKQVLTETVRQGTGRGAYLEGQDVLGKTGSAEWEDSASNETHVDGWFAGAIKLEGEWVVLVVHIREGGTGSDSAVPLFKSILSKLLS